MIINKLKMNLNRCTTAPTVDAVQGDSCSRILEIGLYSAEKPFALPQNLAVLIRYRKADGKGGEYDTLPDGSSAWYARGNILSVTLAPQVLTYPGDVFMTVTLVSEGKQLSTFPVRVLVQPSAQPLLTDSEDYFKITGFLVAPGNARSGQFLQISSVDDSGRVTGIIAADAALPDQDDEGSPADWAASEGQPGHILNRPFYAEMQEVTVLEPTTLTAQAEMDGMAPIMETMDVYDGMVCTVTYNGTDYACTATSIADAGLSYWYLGNPSFFGDEGTEGTDLPFGVIAFGPEAAAIMQIPGIAVSFAGDTTFTLGITGIKEVVHPVPKKFMADVRSQKKIILNLDTIESNMPIADTADMDTGEIQAALSVIYKGAEHAVLIVDREETFIEEYNYTYRRIDFLIAHQSSYGGYQLHGVSTCRWDTNGISVKFEGALAQPFTDAQATVPCFYARMPGETEPHWRRITDTYLDAIVLKSTTYGSVKKFKVTVNDDGQLNTTLL